MNFPFTSILQLSLQIIERSFSYLSACFITVCKACFKSLYGKFYEALIGDNVSKGYDCFCGSFFGFEEGLTSSNPKILIKCTC